MAKAQKLAHYGNRSFDLLADKVTWSEELYNIFGTDRETFLETHGSFIHLVDEEDREHVLQTILRSREEGLPFDIDYCITTVEGEKRYIHELGFAERNSEGKIIRLFGTAQNITLRKKAEEEIVSYNRQLKELTAHLQSVREEERTRIAREIHDELGQQLAVLRVDAAWIGRKMGRNEESIQEKLSSMISLIDETGKTIQRISSELRTVVLDDLGLIAALEWQGQEFEKHTGIQAQFFSDLRNFNPGRNLSINIFRVYQEALTNIVRHANATKIETVLEEKDGSIRLVIKDDGQGIHLNEILRKNSLGLIGMKERALMLHGDLTIESNMPNGTIIILKVPSAAV